MGLTFLIHLGVPPALPGGPKSLTIPGVRRSPKTGQPYPWIVRSTAMVNNYYIYAFNLDTKVSEWIKKAQMAV